MSTESSNENYVYDIEVAFVGGGMRIETVRCLDKNSPLTAIEKAIKAHRRYQRRTSNYSQVSGFRVVKVTHADAMI